MDHIVAVFSVAAIVIGWMIAILGCAISAGGRLNQIKTTLESLRETDEQIVKSQNFFNQRLMDIERWISRKDRRFIPRRKNDL